MSVSAVIFSSHHFFVKIRYAILEYLKQLTLFSPTTGTDCSCAITITLYHHLNLHSPFQRPVSKPSLDLGESQFSFVR